VHSRLTRVSASAASPARWQIISYGGARHSFTNPQADSLGVPAIAYNKLADECSWKAMLSFFEEIFAASG